MRKLILTVLFGMLVLLMGTQAMASKNTGNPFFKLADGYVTSDFTKGGGGIVAAPAMETAMTSEPAMQPESDANQPIRYYRYDSRLPDAGRILPGGRVIYP